MREKISIKELLETVEVERKALGQVATYVRDLTYNKSNESGDNRGYKVLRANNITLSSNTLNYNDIKTVKVDTKVKDTQKLYKNDILISAASGSREHVGKVAFISSDMDYYFGGFMGVIRSSKQIKSRFLFHILTSDIFQRHLNEMLNSSTINNLNSTVMNNFIIPIPPLHVQNEIVRILDNFTELTAELTAELTSRKKQYSYYLDKLFAFENTQIEFKPLGELGEFIRGKRFVRTDMKDEGFPCIHYGEMYTHYNIWAKESKSFVNQELIETKKLRIAQYGDVVIVAAGETIEDIGRGTAWLGDTGVVIHDACFFFKSSLNPKYVAYFTRTRSFHDQIKKHISSGKISAINSNGLSKAQIPIPYPKDQDKSLQEQQRIVDILDKFDTLTNSISEGLPKEIKLREQQYEYYRDLLLTFPKDKEVE